MNIIMDVLQVSVALFRKHKKISVLFLDTSDEWNETETLQDIIRFVTELCVSGLIVEQGDYLLLHETLRFFEMVTVYNVQQMYSHDNTEFVRFEASPLVCFMSSLICDISA